MSAVPLPEPVYHQWRRKNMPWSLEFAFNSMCHATTDDSEVRTLHTADQLHAYGAACAAERDAVWRDAVMFELDSNGQAQSIVEAAAAAIRASAMP